MLDFLRISQAGNKAQRRAHAILRDTGAPRACPLRLATFAGTLSSALTGYSSNCLCVASLASRSNLYLTAYMPRNKGIGRKKPKKKAKNEHAAEDAAAAEGVIPAVEAQSKKRVCQKRTRARGAHTSPPGTFFAVVPPRRTTAHVEGYAEQVRAAAEALEKASFVVELAEERHRRHLRKGEATLARLRKLREKDGERSASWSRGWIAAMDELDAEEQKLDGELQLRLDEQSSCELKLAEHMEFFEELRCQHKAWQEYEKARLEARLNEALCDGSGSSPDPDSDSDSFDSGDSDEEITLDEMMQQCMVDFDAALVDGASRRARGKMAAEPAKGGVSDGADASTQASTSSAVA